MPHRRPPPRAISRSGTTIRLWPRSEAHTSEILSLFPTRRSSNIKAAQLCDDLKTAGAKAPMPGHFLLLRHVSGDDWDYAVIEHNGPKMVVDPNAPPPPAASRDLAEWHDDTLVAEIGSAHV